MRWFTRNVVPNPAMKTMLWLSLPIADYETYIADYVRALEVERTDEWCTCEWIVHPDDMNKARGLRRKRRGETSLDCPIHTKEGFLIGFIKYVNKRV